MSCEGGISKEVVSDCTTQKVAGLEVKIWSGNRKDIASVTADPTNPSKITAIQMATGKRLWSITGVKKLIDVGTDLNVVEDRDNQYTHYLGMQFFESTAGDVENMSAMEDLFFIVEMKSKNEADSADGTFRMYGKNNGMYKTSLTQRANDLDSAAAVEFGSEDGAFEPYPWWTVHTTDYATTLAMIVGQETPQA